MKKLLLLLAIAAFSCSSPSENEDPYVDPIIEDPVPIINVPGSTTPSNNPPSFNSYKLTFLSTGHYRKVYAFREYPQIDYYTNTPIPQNQLNVWITVQTPPVPAGASNNCYLYHFAGGSLPYLVYTKIKPNSSIVEFEYSNIKKPDSSVDVWICP